MNTLSCTRLGCSLERQNGATSHRRLGLRLLRFMFVVALVSASPPVRAEDGPESHGGTFLRLSGGPGYARSVASPGGKQYTFDGGGATLSIAIGGCIIENLALHAEVFGASIVGPSVKIDGNQVASGGRDSSLTSFGMGAGLTYYFMPTNLYLSASFGLGQVSAREGGLEVQSDTGMAADFLIGKEWWVSANWGLGIAGQLVLTSVPARQESSFVTTGVGILLSATYN